MADTPSSATRHPRAQHVVRCEHAGAKHLLSNFDTFHLPPPEDQENRYQPQRDADAVPIDAEFVSSTPVQPRWKHKDLNRKLQVDQLERHMDICLAWEGNTVLEITTFRKPAGDSTYLKINRITQWKDGFDTSSALYEPLLEVFEGDAKGEQWKADVLRIVHRGDDQAWWHVQERMWRDKLRDPYKMGWKARERVEKIASKAAPKQHRKLPWLEERSEPGMVTKRKLPLGSDEQAQPNRKGKRKLPWITDQPVQRGRKPAGVKKGTKQAKKSWNPGVDSLSGWFRDRGEIDPDDDDEEFLNGGAMKTEGDQ